MTKANKKPNLILIMIIYIAGIFMGAIDTGIVTPARTVIQANLNVNEQTGIWMITIYTLAYAASIPIIKTTTNNSINVNPLRYIYSSPI